MAQALQRQGGAHRSWSARDSDARPHASPRRFVAGRRSMTTPWSPGSPARCPTAAPGGVPRRLSGAPRPRRTRSRAGKDKGVSIWDAFAHTRARSRRLEPATSPCDHYARGTPPTSTPYGPDGANAYRFSVSWPRVVPTGEGDGGAARPRPSTTASPDSPRPRHRAGRDALPLGPAAVAPRTGAAAGSTATRRTGSPEPPPTTGPPSGDRVHSWITINEAVVNFDVRLRRSGTARAGQAAVRLVPGAHHVCCSRTPP